MMYKPTFYNKENFDAAQADEETKKEWDEYPDWFRYYEYKSAEGVKVDQIVDLTDSTIIKGSPKPYSDLNYDESDDNGKVWIKPQYRDWCFEYEIPKHIVDWDT